MTASVSGLTRFHSVERDEDLLFWFCPSSRVFQLLLSQVMCLTFKYFSFTLDKLDACLGHLACRHGAQGWLYIGKYSRCGHDFAN